jgi:hypothetical protein
MYLVLVKTVSRPGEDDVHHVLSLTSTAQYVLGDTGPLLAEEHRIIMFIYEESTSLMASLYPSRSLSRNIV